MRFGQVQRFRETAKTHGMLAQLYIFVFGTTSLFALNCFILLKKAMRSIKQYPLTILDAGCGKGDFTFAIAELFPKAQVQGVDISQAKTEEFSKYADNISVCKELNAKLKYPNVSFVAADLLNLQKYEEFDLIICIHVLEHIEENEHAIFNLAKALKPGGHLYIQMPSKSDLNITRLEHDLKERLEWEKAEHIALLELSELEEFVKKAGLEIVESNSEYGYFLTLAWQWREALLIKKKVLLAALMLPMLNL